MAGKFYFDRKNKVQVVCLAGCAVVSVFGSGGKMAVILLWRESFITTGKKSSSRLSGGLCCCVSFWFWQEIGIFFVVAASEMVLCPILWGINLSHIYAREVR